MGQNVNHILHNIAPTIYANGTHTHTHAHTHMGTRAHAHTLFKCPVIKKIFYTA
jgi:hypothetical protein